MARIRIPSLFILSALLCGSLPCLGQAFTSGSTGSYGPLNVTTDTNLDMPPDGVFHCTTVTVAADATLRFKKNPLNTPVYLLATGNVVIAGTIDVSGRDGRDEVGGPGGPGGFDGGMGPYGARPASEGQGPGGGQTNANGVFANPSPPNDRVYGNTLLVPLIGGSGGGGYDMPNFGWRFGGGGGGGAILISSSTSVYLTGSILARGGGMAGLANYGSGSGGAVRLLAPAVSGTGKVDVSSGAGSFGRIRIDSLDPASYSSLSSIRGVFSSGSYLVVFPPGSPRLDIVMAAGIAIAEGTNAMVSLIIPPGSGTNQVVRVQARNFTNDVPIRIKVTPEFGPSTSFDDTILLSSGNPPFADVKVYLVPDTVCHLNAWTR